MLSRSLRPLLAGTSLLLLLAAPAAAQRHGPETGALVIVGGAMRDTAIVNRFIALAGGPGEARIVVVPTAGGADTYEQDWGGAAPFREAGAQVTILHTTDPKVADTPEFAAPLADATGVWFAGGRQWRLADSYLNTRTHEAFRQVLRRGGVIGGSSAGASIQADFMVRGDTRGNTVMMGDHQEGLGFIRGVGIDQHLLARNRQFDMLEVIEAHPELLGIGLDENTGIVVTGDRFEVVGQSYVAIYDPAALAEAPGRFTLLGPGTVYDLAERSVVPRERR
ncbi:MAG: cyanophycinase [Gemmatimonadota bacterium]